MNEESKSDIWICFICNRFWINGGQCKDECLHIKKNWGRSLHDVAISYYDYARRNNKNRKPSGLRT